MALAFWTQKQDIGPSARAGSAMAYDATNQRVVLFGGDPGADALSDTWEWDGRLWTEAADTGPSGRYGHAMAYDPARQRIVLFGGANGAAQYRDTWAWDGSDWTQVADTGPAARVGASAAFDLSAGTLVLFGGSGGGTLFGDTWVWDGTEWTQVQDVGPSPRQSAAMALDVTTSRPVLFGGADAAGAGLGDTWTWDGSSWTQAADTGPAPRVGSGMALDSLNPGQGVVLFGGINSIDPALAAANRVVYADTWRWKSGSWTKVQDIGPGARWGHAMSHRTADQRVVVFGGASGFAVSQSGELSGVTLRDTWEQPFADAGAQPQPGGGQPQPGGGQPQPGTADVATVTVQPGAVPNVVGEVIDVGVTFTNPLPMTSAIDILIAVEDAGGNWTASSPPGFDFQTPQTIAAGSSGTQFQVTRNADPLPAGTYAVAVALQGGAGGYQIGMFTIGP